MKLRSLNLLLLAIFLVSFTSYSQTFEQDYWNSLLNNNPKEALEKYNKSFQNPNKSIESIITHAILRNENGLINSTPENFVENVKSHKDYEYYLYAFWNNPFFFDNYITTGFHNNNSSRIDDFNVNEINNSTVKNALLYLKAVKNRDNKNFKIYHNQVGDIPVINNWQFCGVFENLNRSGFDVSYEPELYAKSDKTFNANSNGTINWYVPNEGYKKESFQFFSNHAEYGYGVHYAQTFITSKESRRVQLRLGNSSAFKVWLNDVLILENSRDVATDLDAYTVDVTLNKGVNRLLIKNAEYNGVSYFVARFVNNKGEEIEDLSYSENYSDYKKSTLDKVNPVRVGNAINLFFEDKVKNNPKNFFYKYALINTYFRNQQYEKANKVLSKLIESNPKSSLLRILKTFSYSYEGNYNAVNEVNKNILLDDPNYYYSLVKKTADANLLKQMNINELEQFMAKVEKATDYPVLKYVTKFMLDARNEDIKSLRETMTLLSESASDRRVVLEKFIPLYATVFKEQEKTINEYEKILSKKYSSSLMAGLSRYYEKLDRKEDVITMYKSYHEVYPQDNTLLFNLIKKMHSFKMYKRSVPYLEKMLKNYPYSFQAMEYMGNAQQQIGNLQKALAYFKKSLVYNNSNSKLLKKIEILSRDEVVINDYEVKDVYNYIKKSKGIYKVNNYGSNMLLDNRVVQIYESGTIKSKNTYLYEITDENGIENYKEYDLGLSGNYTILKGEVIKKDNSIVPAQRTKSKFVFNSLEVGDVIYISYQYLSTGTGRFYKDFVDTYQFDSENFCLRSKYSLIVPNSYEFDYRVENGKVPLSIENSKNFKVYNWELLNAKELPKSEDYRPSSSDYARILHISTIKSWNVVANWYSDLVRSQSEFNSEVEEKYNDIFPEKDVLNLTETERAKRIYYYIMKNFNYSFVEFKQSGFVPQKPAKTLSSKLGDCKDFSTLFATLGRKAGLDVNLVLILTSDYGKKSLVLPSQDFNHCIVKVVLDGKDQFLELTDKNLPFKSVPSTLLNSTGLIIPYMSNTSNKSNLFNLGAFSGLPSKNVTKLNLRIDEDKVQHLEVNSFISGSLSSAYFDIFNEPNYELVKKGIEEDFKARLGEMVLDTITDINAVKGESFVSYTSKIRIKDKTNEMGSMTFFKLPIVSHTYNSDIINYEKRNYDIMYQNYENANYYQTSYKLEIPKNKKFIEIPEDSEFKYKEHYYRIKFKLLSDNQLEIEFIGKPDLNDIRKNEYQEFKGFVEKVLKAKDILIGYK